MQNQNLKNKNRGFYAVILIFAFCVLTFIGCATAPPRDELPTYSINNVTYLPLISLCKYNGLDWEYDTFTRAVKFGNGAHKISVRAGDVLVIVDGRLKYLKHPVELYQGAVVVPYKFKEEFIDTMFKKGACVSEKPSLPVRQAGLPVKGTALTQIKRIVIDAGHGGRDPGATGKTGLREKDVTLDIAKRLAKLLKDGGVEVVMTRSNDVFITLQRRLDIANKSKADIFVSIHANANRLKSMNGFEIYYISPNVNDLERASSAAGSMRPDFDSSCFDKPSLNLNTILWDMLYTYDRAVSIDLANAVCRTAKNSLNARIIGVKGAKYYVLKGANMPAILIETGFLSNRSEERLLRNSFYRQQIAEAIRQGIDNYAQDYMLTQAN